MWDTINGPSGRISKFRESYHINGFMIRLLKEGSLELHRSGDSLSGDRIRIGIRTTQNFFWRDLTCFLERHGLCIKFSQVVDKK